MFEFDSLQADSIDLDDTGRRALFVRQLVCETAQRSTNVRCFTAFHTGNRCAYAFPCPPGNKEHLSEQRFVSACRVASRQHEIWTVATCARVP